LHPRVEALDEVDEEPQAAHAVVERREIGHRAPCSIVRWARATLRIPSRTERVTADSTVLRSRWRAWGIGSCILTHPRRRVATPRPARGVRWPTTTRHHADASASPTTRRHGPT